MELRAEKGQHLEANVVGLAVVTEEKHLEANVMGSALV